MAKIIAIVCHKGGVGKTTTAASLGALLASRGSRVLLVDTDPQMNLTRSFTDDEFKENVYSAFCAYRKDPAGAVLPVYPLRDRLDIVPGAVDASGIDIEFASMLAREHVLEGLLAPVRRKYDYIFIDCPAQLGITTVNALVAADCAIVPMTCDAYSAHGLGQIAFFLNMCRSLNRKLSLAGVLVTRFRERRIVDKLVAEKLCSVWGDKVFGTMIRENAAIVQAPLVKKDIFSYDPRSNGAKDYADLLDELEKRLAKRGK